MWLIKWYTGSFKKICCCNLYFRCIELANDFAVGFDESLLKDSTNTFEIANVKDIFCSKISWMVCFYYVCLCVGKYDHVLDQRRLKDFIDLSGLGSRRWMACMIGFRYEFVDLWMILLNKAIRTGFTTKFNKKGWLGFEWASVGYLD